MFFQVVERLCICYCNFGNKMIFKRVILKFWRLCNNKQIIKEEITKLPIRSKLLDFIVLCCDLALGLVSIFCMSSCYCLQIWNLTQSFDLFFYFFPFPTVFQVLVNVSIKQAVIQTTNRHQLYQKCNSNFIIGLNKLQSISLKLHLVFSANH